MPDACAQIKPQAYSYNLYNRDQMTLSNHSFLVTPTFHMVLLSQILYNILIGRLLVGIKAPGKFS